MSASVRTTAQLRTGERARLTSKRTTTTTRARRVVRVQAAAEDDEVALLEKALKLAKTRKNEATKSAAPVSGPAGAYSGASFNVKTFNAISPVGLNKFPKGKYAVSGDDAALPGAPMAMMLRSHKLQVSEVAPTVRGIVRCGAGTNNIPVKEMSDMGIPVFNTPGANANAVKELVVCSLLLASRGIIEGNKHVNDVINVEENGDYAKISTRIEKDKAMFGGTEIEGKTLGVIGLGAIGSRYVLFFVFVSFRILESFERAKTAHIFFCKISTSIALRKKSSIFRTHERLTYRATFLLFARFNDSVVNAALGLGMKVVGYDPVLSLEAAWRLPGDKMSRADDLDELFEQSDYITIHVPYIKGVTHHLIDARALAKCKPGVHFLNFARGEIIDGAAVKAAYDAGKLTGKYVSDFSDPDLMGHPRHIVLPHLGASTEEAEENSAAMAAETLMDFLETGTIRNSVNFPTTILPPHKNSSGARLCIVNKNESGALGEITTFLGTQNCNILQQINTSRDNVAYTVIDLEKVPEDPAKLQDDLAKTCPMVTSSRFIGSVFNDELGQPGTFFWVRENGN